MAKRSDLQWLQDMASCGRDSCNYVRGYDHLMLEADKMRKEASLYLMTCFGEAAGNVSEQFRLENPHIPWPEIKALRNRIVHAYLDVNLRIIVDIVHNEILPVLEALEAHLGPP